MHGFANPKRFLALASWLTPVLLASGMLLTAAALVWGFTQVPPDRLMGETVRILFIHVPTAWLGMGGWTAIAVSSLVFLVWRHPLAAIAARGAACRGWSLRWYASPPDRSGAGRHGAHGGYGTAG